MRPALQRAAASNTVRYERRRPEQSTLYQLVQEHLETFLAQVEAQTGAPLPQFVKDEFDAFLECGILAYGFLRLRCAECAHEKLVAFSCKRRGFCPSCGARRMAETAAHLVDCVIPPVPVRQWVLSFPISLRTLLAAHPQLLSPVLQVVHRLIATFLIKQSGLKRTEARDRRGDPHSALRLGGQPQHSPTLCIGTPSTGRSSMRCARPRWRNCTPYWPRSSGASCGC
jgi:hypothetical protein